jgi:hypothetical protein
MPLVTLTARTGKSSAFNSAIPDGVHRALIAYAEELRARRGRAADRVDKLQSRGLTAP